MVSVLIVTWNSAQYLHECLASIDSQEYRDLEVVIIDNASTDGTAEFLAAHPEICVVSNETNIGCGPAWTQGAVVCAGNQRTGR